MKGMVFAFTQAACSMTVKSYLWSQIILTLHFRVSRTSWSHTSDLDAILNALFMWLFKKKWFMCIIKKDNTYAINHFVYIIFPDSALFPWVPGAATEMSTTSCTLLADFLVGTCVQEVVGISEHIFIFHCYKITKYLVMDYKRREQCLCSRRAG